MPTSSDLVTDLPADFEVFGQAVDTSLADLKGGTTGQVLKKNSNTDMDFVWGTDSAGMTNPMTTTGDTIYSSSGSTPARLGIGSTGNVLTVSGGLPVWAAPTATGKNFTLLNAGGTALSGSATVTVSGISNKDTILVFIDGASADSTSSAGIGIRINTDTTSKYWQAGQYIQVGSSYSTGFASGSEGYFTPTGDTRIGVGNMSASNTSVIVGAAIIQGCNSTGGKVFNVNGGASYAGNATPVMFNTSGVYTGTSTVSSVSVFTDSSTFDAGRVYVYASA